MRNDIIYFLVNKDSPNMEEIVIPVIPQSINYNYNANWTSIDVLGRLSPIHQYNNGSDITYSFELILHEDLFRTDSNKVTLVSIVDKIKSLSYPRQLGNMSKPERLPIYFQLGEISGYCIVDTKVTWGKPLREGNYVFATVSFTLTASEFDVQTASSRDLVVDETESVFTESVHNIGYSGGLSSSGIKLGQRVTMDNYLYDTSVSDLINREALEQANQINRTFKAKTFDLALEKLNNYYGDLRIWDEQMKDAGRQFTNPLQFITQMTNDLKTKPNEVYRKLQDKRYLNDLISQINSYVNTYYDTNRDFTPSKRDAVIDGLTAIVYNLSTIASEVLYYGAGN